jgi:hypothetical protein
VYVYVRNREAEAMQHVGLGADHGAFGVTFSRVAGTRRLHAQLRQQLRGTTYALQYDLLNDFEPVALLSTVRTCSSQTAAFWLMHCVRSAIPQTNPLARCEHLGRAKRVVRAPNRWTR